MLWWENLCNVAISLQQILNQHQREPRQHTGGQNCLIWPEPSVQSHLVVYLVPKEILCTRHTETNAPTGNIGPTGVCNTIIKNSSNGTRYLILAGGQHVVSAQRGTIWEDNQSWSRACTDQLAKSSEAVKAIKITLPVVVSISIYRRGIHIKYVRASAGYFSHVVYNPLSLGSILLMKPNGTYRKVYPTTEDALWALQGAKETKVNLLVLE